MSGTQNSAAIAKAPPTGLFRLTTDQWTKPFWDAAREHRLVGAACADCGRFRMPPTPFCPHCRSQRIDWRELSGRGILYSYTIVARAIMPEMADSIPYVPALVDLPDAPGTRLITNVVGSPLDRLRIGAPLRVTWLDTDDGVTIPMFTLEDNG